MQFTKEQLGMINVALQTTEKGEARTFPLTEQAEALSIFEKIKVLVDEKEQVFIDGDVDFTTKEKALVLKLIDREWGVQNLKLVFTIRELLQ